MLRQPFDEGPLAVLATMPYTLAVDGSYIVPSLSSA